MSKSKKHARNRRISRALDLNHAGNHQDPLAQETRDFQEWYRICPQKLLSEHWDQQVRSLTYKGPMHLYRFLKEAHGSHVEAMKFTRSQI